MNGKIMSLLSLACRAGKLKSGEYSCEKAMQAGECCLVIIAADASQNTKKKFINKAFFYEKPAVVWGCKEYLSAATGKTNRATVVVTDEGFSKKLFEMIEKETK